MDVFELQAELAQQWLCLMGLAVEASTNAAMVLGRQTSDMLLAPATSAAAWPVPGGPSWLALTDPFQLTHAFSPNPLAHWLPWSVGSMPQWPWTQAMWPMPASPWAFAGSTWPFAMIGGSSALTAWLPSGYSPFLRAAAPLFSWRFGQPTALELVDQVATAYRTAGGHAVAIVLGPLGAAIDPGSSGRAWWQAPALPGCA